MKDALGHGSNAHLGAAIKARRAGSMFGQGIVPVSGGEPHGLVATAAKQIADMAKHGVGYTITSPAPGGKPGKVLERGEMHADSAAKGGVSFGRRVKTYTH